jgi:cytochrome b pre-mRNA-processing protein 3
MFYGRVEAYVSAIDTNDQQALEEALQRNLAPESKLENAAGLALYVMKAAKNVEKQMPDAFLLGKLDFTNPESA